MTHQPQRPAEYARPVLALEWDGVGDPSSGALAARWDLGSAGRVSFGPGPDGKVRVSVVGPADQVAVAASSSPASLRVFAEHLLAVADAADAKAPAVRLARCTNYREDVDRPCDGVLAFRTPPASDAACGTCGARCGYMVADYVESPMSHG